MKILETLHNEDTKPAEKLAAVTKMVDGIRSKYGNEDVEITKVKIPTANGAVDVGLLTTAEKVAVATQAITAGIQYATAEAEACDGVVFDREFEAYVATSPVLTNINTTSDSEY